ncbi:hypothetical protein PX52LOC_08028 [Limnoglobus roseus]|uniref:Uncharacterized protein n=2 Tax=Limnoglobus roseus TaxID=2598579 RepID=A0A5C1AS98_9BACT|nr:hypothetical protein PX52LOC_08028 [Limnoglobus roseus]
MTHGQAWAAVQAVWPHLDFYLYHANEIYHREGSHHEGTGTQFSDVLAAAGAFFRDPPPVPLPKGQPPGTVTIRGATTFPQLVRSVYGTFGLMPEIEYPVYRWRGSREPEPDHATVTRLQTVAARERALFVRENNREPTPADVQVQAGWFGFGTPW